MLQLVGSRGLKSVSDGTVTPVDVEGGR